MLYFYLRLLGFIDNAIVDRVAIVNGASVVDGGIACVLNVVHVMRVCHVHSPANGCGITKVEGNA